MPAIIESMPNLLAGWQPRKDATAASDAKTLNAAIGGEFEAVAAYQVAADSGLLQKPLLDVAITFQGQHQAHAEFLAKTVKALGGKPTEPRKIADYNFPTATLKTQSDVLQFGAGLEQGAARYYFSLIAMLDDRDLAKAIAGIMGDEAMHWAILRQALGDEPVPSAFPISWEDPRARPH